MNKIILLSLFFTFSLLSYSQDTQETTFNDNNLDTKELKWEKNFKDAQRLAKKKNKPLLIFFTGSDWCGPCKVLHADLLESDDFIRLANKELILYEANFPRRTDLVTPEQKQVNHQIKRQYGIRGYPTIILISSDGKELGRRSGYSRMAGSEYHLKLIKKAIVNN